MPAEIIISAALVVLAIAFSAALMAVCVVVGSAFVSITFALTGREPRQLVGLPQRRVRAREPREEPAPEKKREPAESDLAADIMTNAGEGIIVYDGEMRCQVWNRFMEDLTGLRTEHVLGKRAGDFFPLLGDQPIEEILARVLKGETVSVAETSYMVPGTEREGDHPEDAYGNRPREARPRGPGVELEPREALARRAGTTPQRRG